MESPRKKLSAVMKKNIRKQIFEKAAEAYRQDYPVENTGYVNIFDIFSGAETPEEIEDILVVYLDENCNNGYHSRWTSFGYSLWTDTSIFRNYLIAEYYNF